MGTKHESSFSVQSSDSKKKRRVDFFKIDSGVEANNCIKIYLVSKEKEVDLPGSFCLKPVDLNHFFGEDGKIYGYESLKITIWVSSISLRAYADIYYESTSDRGKGITNIKSALQDIFAENLMEKKYDFLQSFSTDSHYVKSFVQNGQALELPAADGCNGDSNVEVFRIVGAPLGHLYSRLVPFVLLLVDGSNPIDITDPSWQIYLLVQKAPIDQEDSILTLLGFAAIYQFYKYPDSRRLRLGQILILPPYQRKGYGSCLLKVLNNVAVSENFYDLTVEEPEDSLQYVRTLIDVQRLLDFSPIEKVLSSVVGHLKEENLSKKSSLVKFRPPTSVIEVVRKSLKINRKQFLQCWEVLIYLRLDHQIHKCMENFRTIISARVKSDVIGKDSEGSGKQVIDVPTEYDQEVSFVMFKSQNGEAIKPEMDENQSNQEETLQKLVDERMKEILLIAGRVSKAG